MILWCPSPSALPLLLTRRLLPAAGRLGAVPFQANKNQGWAEGVVVYEEGLSLSIFCRSFYGNMLAALS